MGKHEDRIDILEKYLCGMGTRGKIYYVDEISDKQVNNAIKSFAKGLDKDSIIGMYDTSLVGNISVGWIFTDAKFYCHTTAKKPLKIWYDDIESIEIRDDGKDDRHKTIILKYYDGSKDTISDTLINKTPLKEFLDEIRVYDDESFDGNDTLFGYESSEEAYGNGSGIAVAAYGQVNKLYEEEKFHARQGHGFAAERANNMFDKITGHDAKIVGDDNVKNGPDRVVDGVYIQSKYCSTGQECVNSCFDENGNFRYTGADGKPMNIEVPSDKYDAAVRVMEEKIRQGKVKGVTNPDEAKNIIRKGHFTYKQALNIAKAEKIESIAYDSVTGMICGTTAFGVTAAITLATNLWKGEDFDKSLKLATYSGLKVGGTAFVTTVLSSQLSKAGLNSLLVGSSEAIVNFMGPKASAVLINALRKGPSIYGAAAMKSAAKLLRSNVITAAISFVVLSSFDIVNIFRGRISGKQLFKNMTNTAVGIGGGTAGWIGGAAVGSLVLPGAGTIVGGIVGSLAGGVAAGAASNKLTGLFIEDDAEEMVNIIQGEFEKLANEYILNQKEAEKTCDKLSDELDGKMLKDMFASPDRNAFARDLLTPIIENEVSKRRQIRIVSNELLTNSLREVLEDISDEYNKEIAVNV